MKNILIAILFSSFSIISCASETKYPDHIDSKQETYGYSTNINWHCYKVIESEYSLKIKCDYFNKSYDQDYSLCNIVYYSADDAFSGFASFGTICTGKLHPGQRHYEYREMVVPEKKHLDFVCGKHQNGCAMFSEQVV